jgi:hypothetical protein
VRSACKASLGFEIVMESFNAANEQQLLVSGLKDTVALTLGSRGEVVSRVVVELMLDALGTASTHILRTGWLPHSSSACFVLTTQFLKVYDLAQDKISPAHAFQTLDDQIKDVAFMPHDGGAHGGAGLVLLALTASGLLLSQPLRPADQANGQLILTHVVPTPPELRGRAGARAGMRSIARITPCRRPHLESCVPADAESCLNRGVQMRVRDRAARECRIGRRIALECERDKRIHRASAACVARAEKKSCSPRSRRAAFHDTARHRDGRP